MWTVYAAQDYARANQLEDWIHDYLAVEAWANPGLSQGLRLQQRWWRGPLLVDVDTLVRVCGPEPGMEYPQEPQGWEQDIVRLQHSLGDPALVPPLIVAYDQGILTVRDGSHRLEAMRRLVWQRCWVLIWYNTEADFVRDAEREKRVP